MAPAVVTLSGVETRGDRRVWITLVVLCAIGAGAAARRIAALAAASLPGSSRVANLDAHFGSKAGLTLLHILPSLLFVLLVAIQFGSVRRGRWRWHRWIGRVTLGAGLVAGLSALALSAHPVGGVVEGTATVCFGSFFLFSLAKAWLHIRNRQVDLHREWVTRMAAIALGVSTTRPIMAVFFATSSLTGLTPQQFFGPAMWIGFLSTWLAGESWIRRSRARRTENHRSGPAPAVPISA